MGKALYSSGHDWQNRPNRKQKRPTKASPEPRAEVQLDLQDATMTDDIRRQIRARQLMAFTNNPEFISELVQDGVSTPERHENQLGPTVGPEINPHDMGSGPGQQHLRPLKGDQDFRDTRLDPDLRQASLDRFAALSANDQTLQSFDQQLTQAFNAVRVLKQSAQQLSSRMQQERDDPELSQLANEIARIIDLAVEPWLLEVEGYFDLIADKTVEGEQE